MLRTKTIIAIGGGKMYAQETIRIDKYIKSLTGKKSPKVLFIPTASDDNEDYCQSFTKIYGTKLKCKIDFLLLYRIKNMPRKEIAVKLEWADIIYVGGGDTQKMVKRWEKYQLKPLLKKAYDNKTILAGMSAGAICWFKYGYSDEHTGGWKITRGLGFIDGICCPHFNDKARKKSFVNTFKKSRIQSIGIGIEDNAALVIQEGSLSVKTAKLAKVYISQIAEGKLLIKQIK